MDSTFKRKYPEQPIIGVAGIIFSDRSVLIDTIHRGLKLSASIRK